MIFMDKADDPHHSSPSSEEAEVASEKPSAISLHKEAA